MYLTCVCIYKLANILLDESAPETSDGDKIKTTTNPIRNTNKSVFIFYALEVKYMQCNIRIYLKKLPQK